MVVSQTRLAQFVAFGASLTQTPYRMHFPRRLATAKRRLWQKRFGTRTKTAVHDLYNLCERWYSDVQQIFRNSEQSLN